ncbi:hypothetical protein DSECCO2_410390 [anaerobic digester metagenome]
MPETPESVALGIFCFLFVSKYSGADHTHHPERLLCLKMSTNLTFSKTTVLSGSSARSVAHSSGHVTLKEIRVEMRPATLIPS